MVLHMYVNDQRKFDRIPFNLRYHYPVSKMTHFASANTLTLYWPRLHFVNLFILLCCLTLLFC